MQNVIFLAEGTEPTEGGHAPENPLGFVPVEFALSLITFGLLLFLIWKFVAPRFEQTFAERTQAIEGGIAAAEHKQAEADAKLAELEQRLGESFKQVAERLVLSHRTVENHVQNTLNKLQMHNRVELVRYAIEQGLDDELS